MSLPITPRDGQYIIARDDRATESQVGSIIVLEQDDRPVCTGIIKRAPSDSSYDEGTRVYFSPYVGYTLTIDRTEYIQLTEHDILGSFSGEGEVYVA